MLLRQGRLVGDFNVVLCRHKSSIVKQMAGWGGSLGGGWAYIYTSIYNMYSSKLSGNPNELLSGATKITKRSRFALHPRPWSSSWWVVWPNAPQPRRPMVMGGTGWVAPGSTGHPGDFRRWEKNVRKLGRSVENVWKFQILSKILSKILSTSWWLYINIDKWWFDQNNPRWIQ